MSKTTIDFKSSGTAGDTHDTGRPDAESIRPVRAGEPASQNTFNRPTQILRERTEVLRKEANENRWARDADRAPAIWLDDGAVLAWKNPDGTPGRDLELLGGSLFLAPIIGTGESRPETQDREFSGSKFPSRAAQIVLEFPGGVELTATSKKLVVEGGNEISLEFKISEDFGVGSVIAVEGVDVEDPSIQPGKTNIVVYLGHTTPASYVNIITQIENHALANSLIELTVTAGNPSTPAAEADHIHYYPGLDSVIHEITESAFFDSGVGESSRLKEGDCIAIWYDTVRLRRESIEEYGNNHIISSANIVNLSEQPEKAANAVPIGRVLEGRFVLATGEVVLPGAYSSLGGEVTADKVITDPSGWTKLGSAETAQAALDSADEALDQLSLVVDNLMAEDIGVEDTHWEEVDSSNHIQNALDSVDEKLKEIRQLVTQVSTALGNHVHDGGTGPESVSKVDLEDHIEWGGLGRLSLEEDAAEGWHRIAHTASFFQHSSKFSTDIVEVGRQIRTGNVNNPGNNGIEIIKFDGGLGAYLGVDEFRPVESKVIKVRTNIGSTDPIIDASEGEVLARNVPIAFGRFKLSNLSPNTDETDFGPGYGIKHVTRDDTVTTTVQVVLESTAPASRLVFLVSPAGLMTNTLSVPTYGNLTEGGNAYFWVSSSGGDPLSVLEYSVVVFDSQMTVLS